MIAAQFLAAVQSQVHVVYADLPRTMAVILCVGPLVSVAYLSKDLPNLPTELVEWGCERIRENQPGTYIWP